MRKRNETLRKLLTRIRLRELSLAPTTDIEKCELSAANSDAQFTFQTVDKGPSTVIFL